MHEASKVSVIMPAYNSEAYIAGAIESVLHQTWDNWELWVIDDASTDPTVKIVEEYAQLYPNIHIIKNPINRGAGAARNKGIKAATGDYIAFLDADDLWMPLKLEEQLKFMQEHDLAMTFSSYILIDEDGKLLQKEIKALPHLTYQKLLKSNYVGNLTGIYDVRKVGKVYAPVIRKRQDWALWLEILKKVGSTRAITAPLACYRVRKNSVSGNKWKLLRHNYRIYRSFLEYGFLKSLGAMSRFLWEHFLVKNRQVKKLK
ncbi:glycosyltransferase family 2 protein [Antarcticibacterium flavum]|uniref:Glycosyltransferase family 2 protein n=1 Tax=Antarcticibacterium flavum TaxID=2058175 RepID=A0A5B7X2U1_9FLAO|nr:MULTISPECIES: glycosyltransferase family 2 protein [Antarcticibacterium]MCM4159202.1 glycosyl transferase [Antarcticibacterium sp. W02-3]QCY69600.1 glycosyltransferase family 2 protein [Antarcticibacterium flavum]